MVEKDFNNLVDMCNDILNHPDDDLSYLDDIFNSDLFTNTEIDNINSALKSIIIDNENLSESGKADLLENSWKINYKFKCPTPSEFLTPKWIGPQADDIYPHVKKVFLDYFDPLINKNKLIMYCCTGWGKSTVLGLIKAYRSLRTIALRNPKQYLKLSESTRLTDTTISFTKATAYDLVIKPMITILETSNKFHKLRYERDMTNPEYTNSGKILFCNTTEGNSIMRIGDIYFDVASDPMDLIGRNIISLSATELTFLSEKMSEEKVMKLLDEGLTRVFNRFGYNNPNTSTVIDSSPNTMEGKIDQWIANHKNDKDIYYVNDKKWEVQPWIFPKWEKTGEVFTMFKGTSSKPSKIVETELEKKDYNIEDLIEVPIDIKDIAKDNPSKILRDYGAIPSSGSDEKLISNMDIIENSFTKGLRNEYTFIHTSTHNAPEGLLWNQYKNKFWTYTGRGNLYTFYRNPLAERFVSVDLAKNHDMATISMCHLECNLQGEKIYVIDFSIPIMAKKNDEINMDAFKFFIADMVKYGGLKINHVSYDGFQSDTTIQYLNRLGFEVERLSVDIVMEYYLSLVSYMSQERLKIGRSLVYKNNCKSLIKTTANNGKGIRPKVDHIKGEWVDLDKSEWEISKMGYYGKDLSDSVCACVSLADMYGTLTTDYLYTMNEVEEEMKQNNIIQSTLGELSSKFGLVLD